MKMLFVVLLVFFNISIFSQTGEVLMLIEKKQRLENKAEMIRDSISSIEERISYLKISQQAENDSSLYVKVVPNNFGSMRIKPHFKGKIIAYFGKKDTVKVFAYVDGYWKVELKGLSGYIEENVLNKNSFLSLAIRKYEMQIEDDERKRNILLQEEHEAERKKNEELKRALVLKYGSVDGTKIFERKIWIGMTEQMLYESWGNPIKINRTVTQFNEYKQCVYNSAYVYLEDGVVKSWQDAY